MRLRLDFAYDGTDFSGWARQPGLRTVEEELSRALGQVLRITAPTLTVGGRTDAGVHARGAVCHLDVEDEVWRDIPGRSAAEPGPALARRLLGVLPGDIVVHAVRPAEAGFDARFSALQRRYSYWICDRPSALDPLRRRDVVTVKRALDVAAMDQAAGTLTGLHDFAAFCKRREGATTVRTLMTYSWRRDDDGLVVASVEADAFCHSMVRALVGVVLPVGEGRQPVHWPAQVLHDRRRDPAVQVMPAHGLCLEEIIYPDGAAALAQRAGQSRAVRELPAEQGGAG